MKRLVGEASAGKKNRSTHSAGHSASLIWLTHAMPASPNCYFALHIFRANLRGEIAACVHHAASLLSRQMMIVINKPSVSHSLLGWRRERFTA